MLRGFCLLALLVAWAPCRAAPAPELPPTPHFRQYGVSDGLPSSRVYTTAQDQAGYLWVGTGNGLARFDGQDFQVFRHDPTDAASLPGNDISAVLIDRQGRLWAGGEGTGLNRLREDGKGFAHWRHDPDNPESLSGDDIMGLAEDAEGNIWVGVYAGGLNRLRADGQGFVHLRHQADDPASLSSDNVLTLHADAAGRLWVGTAAGLDVIEADGRIRHVPLPGPDKRLWVWQIVADGDGVLIASSSGMFRVDHTGTASPWPARKPVTGGAYAALRTRAGSHWLTVNNALILLDAGRARFRFESRPTAADGFPARLALDIMQDSEGGLWLSTMYSGLLYLAPGWREFSRFAHAPEVAGSLQSDKVSALAWQADGALLVGGLNGSLDRLDPRSGEATALPLSSAHARASVLSLAVDGERRIWVGRQGALCVVEDKTERCAGDRRLVRGSRQLLVLSNHDVLAAPVGAGVLRIDPRTLAAQEVPSAFPGSGANMTYQLSLVHGEAWRASAAGLARLDADAGRFVAVRGVKPGRVNAFTVDGASLWLARPDRLERYTLGAEDAVLQEVIDAQRGFPVIEINRMLVDAQGRLWWTSRVGLWRFDPDTTALRRYTKADGLPSPEFTPALRKTADGRVFAGTLAGVVAFRPDAMHDTRHPPRLGLGQPSVLREGQRTSLPLVDGRYHLRWDDNNLRVLAQAMTYVDPSRTRYRSRMLGLDSDWVDTGSRGTREFPGLRAGTYRLQVQASGVAGQWTPAARELVFQVAEPPWRRPWAWALYALAALALLLLAWRFMRNRMQLRLLDERRQLAEGANQAKTRFLATMGHEIRTPMTGVLGMAELLAQSNLDPLQAERVHTIRRSGKVLLKLVNDALDLARIEAGRLELDEDPFDPLRLLQDVVELETGVAQGEGISLQLEHAADLPPRVLGDPLRLRQILMNLIGNALKFGEQRVEVRLDRQGEALRFSVRDDGPGMDSELQQRLFRRFEQGRIGSRSGGSGLGLAICRELVELMHGRIEVESTPGEGSTFRVLLPLPVCAADDGVPPAGAPAPDAPARALHILLVEDDPVIAEVIAGLLAAQGHTVRRAGDALAALAHLAEKPADAALVDIDLPGPDGFELVRMLRDRGDGQGMRIVVVTARTDRRDEERAHEVGADAFLRKPVSGADLQRVLRSA